MFSSYIKNTLVIFKYLSALVFVCILAVLLFFTPLVLYINNIPSNFNFYYHLYIIPILFYYSALLSLLKSLFEKFTIKIIIWRR